jgi:hypothetical protein
VKARVKFDSIEKVDEDRDDLIREKSSADVTAGTRTAIHIF